MEEKLDVLNERGEFTGKVATREECHREGLWHRAVYGFIIDKNSNVLLQKRSQNKKLWPNKWDVTVGGHVDAGEFGRQTIIRECEEELGIDVKENEIVGYITDYFGNILKEYYSPVTGKILYNTTSLAIRKDDPLVSFISNVNACDCCANNQLLEEHHMDSI